MRKHKYVSFLTLSCFLVFAAAASAQTVDPCASSNQNVACTIPQVYGPGGLSAATGDLVHNGHQGHFDNSFNTNLSNPLNSGIATQLALLPIAAPASGISLTFDKSLGVSVASNESFGPILSERAKTVGRHRLHFGFSYEYFHFNNIDGVSLHNIPAVLTHADDSVDNPGATCSINTSSNKKKCAFVRDVISTVNSIDLVMNQYTAYAGFGLTKNIDVSVAIPIVNVRMRAASSATIIDNSGSGDHEFAADPNCPAGEIATDGNCLHHLFDQPGRHSTGIGDVTFRVKGTVWQGEHAGVAVGLDVRVPTGDTLNFQGSGATAIRPFGVWSYSGRISPHVNVGYEWDGDSVLAGNLATGTKGDLPNQFVYSAGVDAGVLKRLTLAFDLIGQLVLNGEQVSVASQSFLGPCNTDVPFGPTGCLNPAPNVNRPNLATNTGNYTITNASFGVRLNPYKRLLISGSVLVKLDNGGLRADYVPLFSLSYTFK
jgi:hypothetical protein